MELVILFGIAVSLFVILLSFMYLKGKKETSEQKNRGVQRRQPEDIPRRAQVARNQRNRLRNTLLQSLDDNEEIEGNQKNHIQDEKMGAKKRAKLEAKAEKKAQREHEIQVREEKKEKEAKLVEERKIKDAKEEEEQKKFEEAQKLAREEKERQDYEEYLKLKESFSIQEEGFDIDIDEKDNLLEQFIHYIKTNKVVVLEDLAMEFKLKVQDVIKRIEDLRAANELKGVIDDRGKFIYITDEELHSVAKFIKQRGRISIAELAERSNTLISLKI